jgi:hypothetical protein
VSPCRLRFVSTVSDAGISGARSGFSRLPCEASLKFAARRTSRADVITQLIGYSLGGRPGERLIARLGLPVSDDTILRRLKKSSKPSNNGAEVVGLDEWAKRKGLNYGTIVVDLECRTVIDVLDKHSTEAVEDWLSAHPEIHTICRDRDGRYARAARASAPQAKQVADRFHLVQNLRETIERELSLRRTHLRVRAQGNAGGEGPLPPSTNPVNEPHLVWNFHNRTATRFWSKSMHIERPGEA